MKYLLIKNKGLISIEALHLMGASTKRGDNSKIGMFGTGNKYAISYLLRNNYDLSLFSGLEKINLSLQEKTFRDKVFNVVCINGERTSLTTEMGMQWELWKVIRELYCNAIDEGTSLMYVVEEIKPIAGETHIYIGITPELELFMNEYDKYFAFNKKTLYENGIGRILGRTGLVANFYRKGIRCFDAWQNSIFDYDFNDIKINEERMTEYSFYIHEKMWALLLTCTNEELIKHLFSHLDDNNIIEGDLSENTALPSEPSGAVLNYLRGVEIMPRGLSGLLTVEERSKCHVIPTRLFTYLRDFLDDESIVDKVRAGKNNVLYRPIEPSGLQQATIDRAMDFFREAKFNIPYKISMASFDKKEVFGTVQKDEIILSELGVERGVNETVNTILEEYIHIKYNVADCTRPFQTASICELINYMKNQNSYVL
ncbi:MAG: hypothetical protein PHS34_09540 [Candidatus Omnitrophica bacterium]|nr:hypothetical protein [Candidatus Omnitrophota bacterium]